MRFVYQAEQQYPQMEFSISDYKAQVQRCLNAAAAFSQETVELSQKRRGAQRELTGLKKYLVKANEQSGTETCVARCGEKIDALARQAEDLRRQIETNRAQERKKRLEAAACQAALQKLQAVSGRMARSLFQIAMLFGGEATTLSSQPGGGERFAAMREMLGRSYKLAEAYEKLSVLSGNEETKPQNEVLAKYGKYF